MKNYLHEVWISIWVLKKKFVYYQHTKYIENLINILNFILYEKIIK